MDAQSLLVQICKEELFKRSIEDYVKNLVNNQMFWQNIFSQMDLNSKITNKINEGLPGIKRDCEEIVKNKLKLFKTEFPQIVTKEITNQLPGLMANQLTSYLNNNQQMINILNIHASHLEGLFYESAKKILNMLVHEEQYQMITSSHLNAMAVIYNDKMKEQLEKQQNNFIIKLQCQKAEFDCFLKGMNETTTENMQKFVTFNTKSAIMEKKIDILEKDMADLIVDVKFYKTIIKGFGFLSLIGGICCLVKMSMSGKI
jgi:ABC-type antimicrobial peptide transport system permease subunit